jgi:hypothetical protein
MHSEMMDQDQLNRIETKLDRLLEIFSGKAPGEVRRKAQADVLHYLTKHGMSVKGQHGGEIEKQR